MGLLTGINNQRYSNYTTDLFNGNGSTTTYTLSKAPLSAAALIVTIDGVKQHSITYTVSDVQLVFSEAPPSGSSIEVIALGTAGVANITPDASVTTVKIVDKNVTSGKLEDNVTITSLGIGTAASGVTGEIRAANAITSFYSDERLKENVTVIDNALEKVSSLIGVTYNANDLAATFGFTDKSKQVGLLASNVESVQPEVIKPAPFDLVKDENGNDISKSGQNYKTVQYERLVPLLVEAIKELKKEVEELKAK